MTSPAIVREVDSAELSEWRKSLGSPEKTGWQRAASPGLPSKRESDPDPGPRPAHSATPAATYDGMVDYLLKWAKADRDSYQVLVQALRTTNPGLVGHLTDAQVADLLEEKVKASIRRVFPRMGRADDLKIKTAGY